MYSDAHRPDETDLDRLKERLKREIAALLIG
jgi:hypothetical protein